VALNIEHYLKYKYNSAQYNKENVKEKCKDISYKCDYRDRTLIWLDT